MFEALGTPCDAVISKLTETVSRRNGFVVAIVCGQRVRYNLSKSEHVSDHLDVEHTDTQAADERDRRSSVYESTVSRALGLRGPSGPRR